MALWKVTTGWQGNGTEGVLVEAHDKPTALKAAREALIGAAAADLDGTRDVTRRMHHRQRLASYQDALEQFRAEEITLPHFDEFG